MKKFWFSSLLLIACFSSCIVEIDTDYLLITEPRDIPGFEGTYYLAEDGVVSPVHIARIAEGSYAIDTDKEIVQSSPLVDSYFLIQMFSPDEGEYSTILVRQKERMLYLPFLKDKARVKQLKARLKAVTQKKTSADQHHGQFAKEQLKKYKDILKEHLPLFQDGDPFFLTKKRAEYKAIAQRKQMIAEAKTKTTATETTPQDKEIQEALAFIQGYLDKHSLEKIKDPGTEEERLWRQTVELRLKDRLLYLRHKVKLVEDPSETPKNAGTSERTRQLTTIPLEALSPEATKVSSKTVQLFTRNQEPLIHHHGKNKTHSVTIKVKSGMENRVAEAFKYIIRHYAGQGE